MPVINSKVWYVYSHLPSGIMVNFTRHSKEQAIRSLADPKHPDSFVSTSVTSPCRTLEPPQGLAPPSGHPGSATVLGSNIFCLNTNFFVTLP